MLVQISPYTTILCDQFWQSCTEIVPAYLLPKHNTISLNSPAIRRETKPFVSAKIKITLCTTHGHV